MAEESWFSCGSAAVPELAVTKYSGYSIIEDVGNTAVPPPLEILGPKQQGQRRHRLEAGGLGLGKISVFFSDLELMQTLTLEASVAQLQVGVRNHFPFSPKI